jgi:hypothetical protein
MSDWDEIWSGPEPENEDEEGDPLLALRGSGRELWADEQADQYVRRLREGWS